MGTAAHTVTAAHEWNVWSTVARVVVTDPALLDEAVAVVRELLDRVDRACSRFRPDSELTVLRPGVRTEVSGLLRDLVGTALDAAERTAGAVDPTVGSALVALGYDRDLREVRLRTGPGGRLVAATVAPVPGWRRVSLRSRGLLVPDGVVLDLGATAKARAAELAAQAVADGLGCGVLVSLGGDIATAGPAPTGDWQVLVQDTGSDPASQVAIGTGTGVATSSTVRRRWRHDGAEQHHVVDPRTSRPAASPWRSVSVVAPSCVAANACATATIALGVEGEDWLRRQGLPARLVDHEQQVLLLGGWPSERSGAVA